VGIMARTGRWPGSTVPGSWPPGDQCASLKAEPHESVRNPVRSKPGCGSTHAHNDHIHTVVPGTTAGCGGPSEYGGFVEKPATDVDLGMPDLAGQLERDLDAPLPPGPLGQALWRVVYGHGDPNDSAASFDSALPPGPAARSARRHSGPQEVAHAEGAAFS
jgi:hypothetical protein